MCENFHHRKTSTSIRVATRRVLESPFYTLVYDEPGILTPGDAKQAFAAGADAVMVSIHGGRQVDGAIGSLDALREIRREIAREHTLILDSGIRSGADVFKAIACGADAVTIGRPHVYGLAIDGARGVESVLRNIIAELDLTMSLSGVSSLAEIDSTMVRVRG